LQGERNGLSLTAESWRPPRPMIPLSTNYFSVTEAMDEYLRPRFRFPGPCSISRPHICSWPKPKAEVIPRRRPDHCPLCLPAAEQFNVEELPPRPPTPVFRQTCYSRSIKKLNELDCEAEQRRSPARFVSLGRPPIQDAMDTGPNLASFAEHWRSWKSGSAPLWTSHSGNLRGTKTRYSSAARHLDAASPSTTNSFSALPLAGRHSPPSRARPSRICRASAIFTLQFRWEAGLARWPPAQAVAPAVAKRWRKSGALQLPRIPWHTHRIASQRSHSPGPLR